jgi:hypothetical protein
MCKGNAYGIIALIVGLLLIVISNFLLLKLESVKNHKWKLVIPDIIIVLIALMTFSFFNAMLC